MKKILSGLVLISFLTVLLVPMIASAEEGPPECCYLKKSFTDVDEKCKAGRVVKAPGGYCPEEIANKGTIEDTEKWGLCCLLNTISTIVDWIFVVLIALAVLFVIMGAFQIVTAGGSPEKVTTGRTYILYAAIGLIVAFIARAIPSLVKAVMGY